MVILMIVMKNWSHLNLDPGLLLESMTESVLVTSSDLKAPGPTIIYVNPAFEQMTGWRREEVIGKSPRLLQGPGTNYEIFADLSERLENGKVWTGRTINYKKDGSQFYMDWSITPIFDPQGLILHYLAVQKDVTHMVGIENELNLAREIDKKRLRQIERKNLELKKLIEHQKKTLDLFTKYVPEAVVKKTLERSEESHRVSAKLEVALLFCDIRGFTEMIEGLGPSEVVELLNIYYSRMSNEIRNFDGVINQFVGDEIFVAFGAPLPIATPEISAVRCAMSMMEQLEGINSDLREFLDSEIELNVGIGINFGSVIAGNVGSDDRLSYAVTGEAVVTAKRIEALTKSSPNSILVSQSVYNKTSQFVKYDAWGSLQLKGHDQSTPVYKVIGHLQ